MTTVSLGTCGIILMFVQGFAFTAQMIIGRLLKESGLPFFRIVSLGLIALSCLIAVGILISKGTLPERTLQKWLCMRGVLGSANFAFLSLAVRIGTPAGDAAALSSINTVVAALAGRLFLKEAMRGVHVLAVLCCFSGALLISKPAFLFGGSGSGIDALPGYFLALSGGFSQAGISICSRKLGAITPWWGTLSVTVSSVIVFITLPAIGLLDDHSLQPFLTSTIECFSWCIVLLSLAATSIAAFSAAGQWCPAAVSATVGTGSRMIWGYVAQIVFFETHPELLTVSGALLMLISVVAMVLTRTPAASVPDSQSPTQRNATDASPEITNDSTCEADEEESLASFIATEFAVQTPHSTTSLRERSVNKAQDSTIASQSIGAVSI